MNEPVITILMPAYNAGKYIHEAISSVLAQHYTDFELLIVNDGSTDDTLAVIGRFDDPRIRVISQANRGVAASLNNGLKHARAPFIARFDADDICYPQRLGVQYKFLKENPGYSLVGSAVDYVDLYGNYVFTYHPPQKVQVEQLRANLHICPFIHSSVLYRKDAVLATGAYNEFAYTFEDHLLWMKLLKSEKACNLQEPLIKVRLNPGSVTIDERWRTKRFRQIKYRALETGTISEAEGLQLMSIGQKQGRQRVRDGAYFALLGKKYLWNNYQPLKARRNLLKVLALHPFYLKYYLLYVLSFVPARILRLFYHSVKTGRRRKEWSYVKRSANVQELNYGS